MASQTDFIKYKFDHYFICENGSKDALNHRELCEMVIRTKKKRILASLARIFFAVELFL